MNKRLFDEPTPDLIFWRWLCRNVTPLLLLAVMATILYAGHQIVRAMPNDPCGWHWDTPCIVKIGNEVPIKVEVRP